MSDDIHRYCGGYYDAHTCAEIDSLTERAEKAEAQVRAVRDWAQRTDVPAVMGDWMAGYSSARRDILSVLDSGGAGDE